MTKCNPSCTFNGHEMARSTTTPDDLTLDEQVKACDDCDGTHFMCPEHAHLSREQEDEQAAEWRREELDDRDAGEREARDEANADAARWRL